MYFDQEVIIQIPESDMELKLRKEQDYTEVEIYRKTPNNK